MLSPDGACKSFDASGNGYVRSESVVAVYLQKAPQAKRIYATLVHSKTNTDGNKSQGKCIFVCVLFDLAASCLCCHCLLSVLFIGILNTFYVKNLVPFAFYMILYHFVSLLLL